MIRRELFKDDFDKMTFSRLPGTVDLKEGFVLRFHLDRATFDKDETLLEYPGQLRVTSRYLRGSYREVGEADQLANYPSVTDGRGGRWLLEAELFTTYDLRPDWKSLKIGIPLLLLGDKPAEREIAIVYTGLRFQIQIDGDVQDENMPVGTLDPLSGPVAAPSPLLRDLAVATDIARIRRPPYVEEIDLPFQCYMPHGYNAWAGDFVDFYHDGLFHVLYLHDRRHHGSRWGMGAHTFCHLTSRDLVDWTDHGAMDELTEPWQSYGTGTMCHCHGRYVFAFGWHTDRVLPPDRTLLPILEKELAETGAVTAKAEADDPGRPPFGANYLVSDDGVHFTPARKCVHPAWNPSIYTQEDGSIALYCGSGTWHAPDIDGPWTLVDPTFPHAGRDEPMRNSCECPSFFSWGDYRYLLMGVTGFWTAKGDGEYENSAAEGYDLYDGLAVPMVSPYHDDRRLLGGWLKGIGWGSCLVLRELIQYPDGRLGMKWPAELMPRRDEPIDGPGRLDFSAGRLFREGTDGESLYLDLVVDPKGATSGRFAIRFQSKASPDLSCELQLDLGTKRAQFAPCPGDGNDFWHGLLTTREAIRDVDQGDALCWWIKGTPDNGLPFNGHDFAIEHVDYPSAPFSLRIHLRRIRKMCATVIDVEIAGRRTMISNRPDFVADEIVFASEIDGLLVDVARFKGAEAFS